MVQFGVQYLRHANWNIGPTSEPQPPQDISSTPPYPTWQPIAVFGTWTHTHNCVATFDNNTIVKFDVVLLITENNEKAYLKKVENLNPLVSRQQATPEHQQD